jgi:hypothetical protein
MGGLFLFGCAHNETDAAEEGAIPEINQAQDVGATTPQPTPVSEKPVTAVGSIAADSAPEVPPAPVKKVSHKKKHKKHAKKVAHHKKHKKHVVKKAADSDSPQSAQ